MKQITIIGGGSSSHSLIAFLGNTSMRVNILTSRPNSWSKTVKTKYTNQNNEVVWVKQGKINRASSNPADVIPGSDLIILCMPVNAYRESLHNIAPYIDKDKNVFVGTIYGQGGFNWMVKEIVLEHELNNVITFAFGLIPWICRIEKYGSVGIVYGGKALNYVALDKKEYFPLLKQSFLDAITKDIFHKDECKLADNFISLTFSVDNQIIHPTRLYSLWLEAKDGWESEDDVPYFYKDYTQESADILLRLDEDYSKIREAIKAKFPHKNFDFMLDYLTLERLTNGSNSPSILSSFVDSKTLGLISTPSVFENGRYVIDKKHRFFRDDIYYGIMIAKWFAQKFDLNVPMIDEILNWAQVMLDDHLIKGDKLIDKETSRFKNGLPSQYSFMNEEILFS